MSQISTLSLFRTSRPPILLFLFALSCAGPIEPVTDSCTVDRDCQAGQLCAEGLCQSSSVQTAATVCEFSSDCALGQWCEAGVCMGDVQGSSVSSDSVCANTAECPMDQYCNPAVNRCQNLLESWCRESQQCPAESPVCSAQSSDLPGQCVECLTGSECLTGYCSPQGRCGEDPNGIPDASENGTSGEDNEGSTNEGSNDNGSDEPSDDDPCSVFGWYGDGVCDEFCAVPDPDCSSDGASAGTGGETEDPCTFTTSTTMGSATTFV